MEVSVYKGDYGPCPYLEKRQWKTQFFYTDYCPDGVYEEIINDRWRRGGDSFYQNHCDGCTECIPVRVLCNEFVPSKSQRRVLRKGAHIRIEIGENIFREEDFLLFCRYQKEWHQSKEPHTEESYTRYYLTSPVTTKIVRYYDNEKFIALGWIDVLPHSLSSVYFAFDPDYAHLNLGTFSIMKEIDIAQRLGKEFLHLGFYVKNCEKMSYKSRFYPSEILVNGYWEMFNE